MNTKQLVTIWYTGLAIDLAILCRTDELWAIVVAILVLGALLILTFRPNEKVKKKALAAWVIAPVILGGTVAVLTYRAQMGQSPKQTVDQLPLAQWQKVEGTAWITKYGLLEVSLYNGSSWTIKDVQVALTIVKANGEKTDERIYDLTGYGVPYKTSRYSTGLGYTLGPGEKFEWYIKSLKGLPR